MATLVLSSVGTAVGGPIGGAVGALAGRQLDNALFGPSTRNGPRLRELDVSLSSYGTAIPRLHGRMRVAGSIIWATELEEHAELLGTGKGQPALTTYSYTANLAVALSSRPITGIGRIWADGKLLRGAAGDLKVGGQMRVYLGRDEQPVDSLIAASEGESRCPAFRDLAYVVFESLDLTDFGNRIPALTFEVIADDNVTLRAMLGETLENLDVPSEINALSGFAIEDSLGASLAALATALPISIDAGNETMVARLSNGHGQTICLDEPAICVEDDTFGGVTGISHHRTRHDPQPPCLLRYFDLDRDFLPSTQHATGRAGAGQPNVIELPATLNASTARMLVDQIAQRQTHAQERMAWRTATLDSTVAPGVLVSLPDRKGVWRVESWEWREAGIELELTRVPLQTTPAPTTSAQAAPEARFSAPTDTPAAASRIVVCEMPWDGANGAPDRPRLAAAVSAEGVNWSGAPLFTDKGDGQLWPLGTAPRNRAVCGTTVDALGKATPLLMDRGSGLTVVLVAPDLALHSASPADLARGENLALVGDELIQFAKAQNLGEGRWCLMGLLRGLHGTEAAMGRHVSGEDFALLDTRITTFDRNSDVTVFAIGRGDADPASSNVHLAGISFQPLSPVHPRVNTYSDGGLHLSWTRRARGGWTWRDGVDVPLAEGGESYLVTYDDQSTSLRAWETTTNAITFSASQVSDLNSLAENGTFSVRQQGTHGLSMPLKLTPGL